MYLGWEKATDANLLLVWVRRLGLPFLLLVLFRYLHPWVPALTMVCRNKKPSSREPPFTFPAYLNYSQPPSKRPPLCLRQNPKSLLVYSATRAPEEESEQGTSEGHCWVDDKGNDQ